jgi:hypothetical protein
VDPFLANHLILQGQHLERIHQGVAAITMEQLRHAQQQAHRDEQTQHMMREFARQTENMSSRLLERTSQTSHEQHQALRNHIAELTAASKRMQEAAERNASIPPSLYAEHKKTQELVQRLLQQPQAQTPGVEGLTSTLTNLVQTVSQGFQTLQQQAAQGNSDLLHQTTQAQVSVATNTLHRQSHELKELLETLKAAVQFMGAYQAQHAAGVDKAFSQLGTHLGQQAAAAHAQAQLSHKVLQELQHLRGQPTTLQQIAQVLVLHNVPDTPENRQLALEYVQEGSSASSSTGVAGPPPQPKAPLQPMGVGGMSKKQEQESSAPLLRMDAQGQPIGHNIHDAGFAELTLATPKVIAAKTRNRMPLKYHRTWGTLATAVMRKQMTAEEAIETLRRMRAHYNRKTQEGIVKHTIAKKIVEAPEEKPKAKDEVAMVPVTKRTKSHEEEGGGKRQKGRSPSIIYPDAPPPPAIRHGPPRPPPGPPPRSSSRPRAQPASLVRPSKAPPPQPSQRPPRPTRAPSVAPRGRSGQRSPGPRQQSPPL